MGIRVPRSAFLAALLAAVAAGGAFAGPVGPVGCPSCIANTPNPQDAQINIGTETVRGTITASTGTFTNLNALNLNITNISGAGAQITGLNASQLLYGTLPTSTVTVNGNYQGITGVGHISSGTWNGAPIGTQWGGTGQNWAAVSQGQIPFFTGTGVMGTLPTGAAGGLFQTNGAGFNPSWTLTPSVLGTNITGIPLANLLGGNLPGNVAINDASISTVSAVKVIGDISGKASGLTAPLPVSGLAAGQLPTSIPASSITVTGTPIGVFGNGYTIPQITVGTDGRIYNSTQIVAAILPAQIGAGPLPGGVTVDPRQVSTGTFPTTAVASSITATGVIPRIYGGPTTAVQLAIGVDGRVSSAAQFPIGGVSTYTAFTNVDNNWSAPQTFRSSVTVVSSVTAGNFLGNGAGLTSLTAANINAGALGSGVIASSIAANGVVGGVYGSAIIVPVLTLTGDGRITNVSSATITGVPASTVPAAGVLPGQLVPGVLLNAGSLDNGPVASSILPSSVAYYSSTGTFTAPQAINGAGLTASSATLTATGAAQYSLATSSGISVPNTAGVYAGFFSGNGAALTNLSTAGLPADLVYSDKPNTFSSSNTFTAPVLLAGTSVQLTGGNGYLTTGSSVTASGFFGNGGALSGIPSTPSIVGVYVQRAGDTMTGQLTNTSTVTITGNAFSVGGSTLVVSNGFLGIDTVPSYPLHIKAAGSAFPGPTVLTIENTVGVANAVLNLLHYANTGFPAAYCDLWGELNPGGASSNLYAGCSGSKTVRINTSGVGIFTDAADALDVNGAAMINALGIGVSPTNFFQVGTSSFVVSNTGAIGVGTSSPASALEVSSSPAIGDRTAGIIMDTRYASDVFAGAFVARHARGTQSNPTGILAGDDIAAFGGRPFESNTVMFSTISPTILRIIAEEDQSSTNHGAAFAWFNAAAGTSASIEKMRLTSIGNLEIGTTTGPVNTKLYVSSGNIATDYGILLSTALFNPGSQPTTGKNGMVYYDSTTNKLRLYNGAWVDITTGSYSTTGGGGGSGITALTGDGAASGTGSVTLQISSASNAQGFTVLNQLTVGSSATFNGTGANPSIAVSSNVSLSGSNTGIVLPSGGFVKFGDNTVMNTASGGGGLTASSTSTITGSWTFSGSSLTVGNYGTTSSTVTHQGLISNGCTEVAAQSFSAVGSFNFQGLVIHKVYQFVADFTTNSSASNYRLNFNGDTGNQHRYSVLCGNGTVAVNAGGSGVNYIQLEATANQATTPHHIDFVWTAPNGSESLSFSGNSTSFVAGSLIEACKIGGQFGGNETTDSFSITATAGNMTGTAHLWQCTAPNF